MARFRPILHARDVTEQQWRVIRVLGEESPLDASEVADRACVLAPSLTRIIRALEERRLISRPATWATGAGSAWRSRRPEWPDSRRDARDRGGLRRLEESYGRDRIEHLLDILGELANQSVNEPRAAAPQARPHAGRRRRRS